MLRKILRSTGSLKAAFVCLISFLLLTGGFYGNYWNVANSYRFWTHTRDCESFVIGRMVKSRQDGLFSAGGLTGAGIDISAWDGNWIRSSQAADQYSAYLEGETFESYTPYLSQPGGQGIMFSVLDGLIPLAPRTNLRLFYMLTSVLSAAALTLVILWFYREFGSTAAIFVACSMIISEWLTVFGRNLWWSTWAFYLPMIAVMFYLRHRRAYLNRHIFRLGMVVFIAMFVKCLINGYEYITAVLIMTAVPLFYYALVDGMRIRLFLKAGLAVAIGLFAAIILSTAILSVQVGIVKGSPAGGIEHIRYAFGKRAHGDPSGYPEVYARSLQAGVAEVLGTYLNGVYFDFNNYLSAPSRFIARRVFRVYYYYLVGLFAIASLLVLIQRGSNFGEQQRRKSAALVFTAWLSLLAPLSWWVIFKSHSFIHTHMNFILWQMPFTFFGFAVCGLAVRNYAGRIIAGIRDK